MAPFLGSDPDPPSGADISIAIDRGGTFCDVIAKIKDREDIVFKLLSEDPNNYADAPSEAIRRVLELATGQPIDINDKLDGSRIASCRIGTTIATNALLEQKGEKFAFLTTKGFKDVCLIGDQTRPKLFALRVEKAQALHDKVVEVDERITQEDYDLNPWPMNKKAELVDPELVRTTSGEIIRVLKKPDIDAVRTDLQSLKDEGYTSVAIAFMHSYLYPEHEQIVANLAREIGFKYVTISSETSPSIKYLRRSMSVCSEAYLYPVIRSYVENFESRFKKLPQRVEFMCSDGGLKKSQKFRGNEALLSGPAGGVVGIAKSCFDGTPLIGFDMGGTSTDVCRYDGQYDYLMESRIADRTINVPMLNIQTVAAGGGSILFARNGLLVVGPESAGAYPGPASYRNGGPLTVTDANLFLGRLELSSFPAIFGKNHDEPLDMEVVRQKFLEITKEFNHQTSQNLTPEEVAAGFLEIANETMSRPIRNTTEARGFNPESHNLVSFGGAGGQHACSIADKLGINRILIHKWSSLLSAYGISQAELQTEASEPYTGNFNMADIDHIRERINALRISVRDELVAQGATEDSIHYTDSLNMRYFGTDTNLAISRPAGDDFGASFVQDHKREFAFNLSRQIVVDSVHCRGVASAGTVNASPTKELETVKLAKDVQATEKTQPIYVQGRWQDAKIYRLDDMPKRVTVHGPALILDKTQTIFVEPKFNAYILSSHVILEKANAEDTTKPVVESTAFSPIELSVFAHRFMSIAEQMGNTLQRTSISTSIRERLDFSCAIFSPEGELVANAPHIPMMAIQRQHHHWKGKLSAGDVLLTNHPEWGGTHLPDLTVVTPVFVDGQIAFYTASRGHHTDIGGRGITSMMPDSRELWEEGINVPSMKIVSGGEFLEDEVRKAFDLAGSFPGCSPTRRIHDNISDLKAQISANQRGINLLGKLCEEFSLPVVHKYMRGIQQNAEVAVRGFLKEMAKKHPEGLEAEDFFDNGTNIKLKITIDPEAGSAHYDFAGTGPQCWGNINCPVAVTHSAVIYTMRCLIDMEIPLNEGCLTPITVSLPKGSILNPTPTVAICGSTIASQRIIDTILRAYRVVAAFQGCASSFGWGMGGRDPATGEVKPGWNYGESIGGGTGAGPGWHGAHAVHAHSTNTRITDAEVIEKRTQVIVRRFEINAGTGGRGRWSGGDGITREIEARIPLRSSILSERRVFAPYGMDGGGSGSIGRNFVFRHNGKGGMDKVNLSGQAVVELRPGEIIQINTPGGGGWGKPEE